MGDSPIDLLRPSSYAVLQITSKRAKRNRSLNDAFQFFKEETKRLKFGQLTQAQISGLEYFIENHTTGEI